MSAPDDTFYNLRRLHRLFALSAIALLAVTIWMIAADWHRPWKAYQRTSLRRPEIEQIWLPELTLDYHFGRVPRFDRCITCHQGIDSGGKATARRDLPQPYAAHSRPELFVGATSPHPMAEFGCTICHDGQGSATDFTWASHMPNDPAQRAAWQKQYHWFANPDWDLPMLPARFAESRCLLCHRQPSELEPGERFPEPPAPKLLAGYQLVRQLGCFGCHEIQALGAMPKVGPSLRDVQGRLGREFLADWIAQPSRFRPHARMPRLFGLDEHLEGQARADSRRYEAVEVRAISEYLLAASRPVASTTPPAGEHSSADRGRKLFQTSGCLACHEHREFPAGQSIQGPDLSALGAKYSTPSGSRWVESWISDSASHWPQTKMPRPDLKPGEIADITAWLLLPADWQPAPLPPLVEKDLDELAAMYSAGSAGTMDSAQKLQYVGQQTIRKRGCAGCHDIPGCEDAPAIGPSLSDWGRKRTALLAFEQVEACVAKLPDISVGNPQREFFRAAIAAKRRDGFLWQKLSAPRSFDYQPDHAKPFNEQLRMGRFTLSDDQREAIITFVLGLIADPPTARYVDHPDHRRQAIVAGRKVIDKYGCAECHVLGLEHWTIRFDPKTSILTELRGTPRVDARGKLEEGEDDDGKPLYYFSLWEPVVIAGRAWPVGEAEIPISPAQLIARRPPWGGNLARLLFPIALADARSAGATASPADVWGWLPPALVNEGHRVQPEWLYQYLLAPQPIRPAVVLHMPQFHLSADEAGALVDYFAATAGIDSPFLPPNPLRIAATATIDAVRQKKLDQAMAIVTDHRTYCAKCHFVGNEKPAGEYRTVQAPNLAEAGRRLRPDYLRRWLANPKSILPYTPMPVNFPPNGEPLNRDLMPGSSLEQLDAVIDLLVNYDWYLGHRPDTHAPVEPTPAAAPVR
jgi:cytochrome c2